ncbi:hypothetical protein NIES4071_67580 [Calothrix sp. NIES-4071]|nr:hypothetical protein NIES4071_67580 [Calothrix sp. NIES-4071]BAZ61036.1 hypothetical protein NIES4105_67540 [Calothrix sp. NIES-4105]
MTEFVLALTKLGIDLKYAYKLQNLPSTLDTHRRFNNISTKCPKRAPDIVIVPKWMPPSSVILPK